MADAPTSNLLGTRLLLPLAILVILSATWLSLGVGFLADDFHLGHEIALVQKTNPGLEGALVAAFTRRWTRDFDVFRPLTILTTEADYALYGTHGGRHHLTNLLIWLITAWIFSLVASRILGVTAPRFRALCLLLFGLYPAAVESLGWLVAREDALVTLFGLLALLVYLTWPQKPHLWALAMIPAFLSKETAVILPPLLFWSDLWLGRKQGWLSLLRRHIPSLLVLLAYVITRLILFGQVGMQYAGTSFLQRLGHWEGWQAGGSAFLHSIEKLVLPLNQGRLLELFPRLPAYVPSLLFLLPLALLILPALVRGNQATRRLWIWAAGWAAAPLLLVSPVLRVGPDLEASRILLLPTSGLLFLVLLGLRRMPRALKPIGRAATLLLLLSCWAGMFLNLSAYPRASRRVQALLSDLESLEATQPVLLLGLNTPGTSRMRPALVLHQGVWLLSAGIVPALEEPFRIPPLRDLRLLSLKELADSGPRLCPQISRHQPQLVGFTWREGRPGFQLLGPASATSTLNDTFLPQSLKAIRRDGSTPLTLKRPGSPLGAGATLRVVIQDFQGRRTTAELPPAPSKPIPYDPYSPPLTPALLAALPAPALLIWIELPGPKGPLARTPYHLLPLTP